MTFRKKTDYTIIEAKNETEWLKAKKMLSSASEAAVVLGKSPFKTQLEIWQEKTGLKEARDISSNPSVIRGKEREPIIREWFIEAYPCFNVEYNQFNIYVSNRESFGMLGATLDGELEVVSENNWNLPVGSKGVLEIKTVSAERPSDTVDNWRKGIVPDYYRAQGLQQMFCYDCDFVIFVAELDFGENAGIKHIILDPIIIKAEDCMEEIISNAEYCRDFWNNHIITQIAPTNYLEVDTSEGREIVPLEADTDIGRFYQNFDLVKASVERIVAPFKGIEFEEKDIAKAKELKANLNKMAKEIDSKRLAVKKKYLQPLEEFEAKAKELKSVVDEVIIPISEQLEDFENHRIDMKKTEILKIVNRVIRELPEDQSLYFSKIGAIRTDKRWLNKTTKLAEIEAEINEQVEAFKKDYDAILALPVDTETRSIIFSEYARTRSLAETMASYERISVAREMARKEEERRKSQELLQRMKASEESKASSTESTPDPDENKTITFTFEASHPSAMAWKNLIEYMKSNGFSYRKLD